MKTIQDGLKSANLDMSIALIWIGQEQVRIAQAQVQCGYIEDALNTANLIKSSYWQSEALSDIAKEQAEVGDIPGALNTANLITDPFYKNEALTNIETKKKERELKNEQI